MKPSEITALKKENAGLKQKAERLEAQYWEQKRESDALKGENNEASQRRFNAERDLMLLRGVVTEYSLAISHPATAKDHERLKYLQGKIAGVEHPGKLKGMFA